MKGKNNTAEKIRDRVEVLVNRRELSHGTNQMMSEGAKRKYEGGSRQHVAEKFSNCVVGGGQQ